MTRAPDVNGPCPRCLGARGRHRDLLRCVVCGHVSRARAPAPAPAPPAASQGRLLPSAAPPPR